MLMESREYYMRKALELASCASQHGEVPVGCVIVDAEGNVIGTGRNRMEEKHNASCHAEIEAISEASAALGDWRLDNCTLYVNLEPCPMCAGAIINSRIGTAVFALRDRNKGACGGVIDLFSENFGHKPAVFTAVCEDESAALLKDFFKEKR